ncbi:MAG: calcium/sodium antiporter [Pirellulaceae bacterium]
MDFNTTVLFICGFALLIVGAEMLVRGASRLAIAAGISPLVVGLTVVAYGTSAPEVAVSVQSAWAGQADIAVGNVVGSNLANILLVLGVSAMITPLIVSRQLVRWSVPVMIGAAVLMYLMALDGGIARWEGVLLLIGAAAFTWLTIHASRRETQAAAAKAADEADDDSDSVDEHRLTPLRFAIDVVLIVLGLAALVLGAGWLVDGAVTVAKVLGVSELVIGLTVVAVGTSLPEIATSIVAAARGQRDIAVGNAVGSNIFNVLLVIGLSAAVSPQGVPVSPEALHFDMPMMIAVSIVCLPVFFTGWVIDRFEGLVFLGYYIAYTIYLYLRSTDSAAAEPFNLAMLLFVIPLTLVVLITTTIRALRRPRE